jgi:cell division protein FtsB
MPISLIKALNRLRNYPDIKTLLREAVTQFPGNEAKQNINIQDRKGNPLRRVIQQYYGGDDTRKPILAFRHDADNNDCKALRAACAALVTARDCDGGTGAKLLFYARFLGHIADVEGKETNDRVLRNIVTSLGYADYVVNKSVPYPIDPEPIGTIRIPTNRETRAKIQELQAELGVKTQTEVLDILIASHLNRAEGVRQLRQENTELINENHQLKEELSNMATNQDLVELVKSLEAKFEALEARLATQSPAAIESTPTKTKTVQEPKEDVSYEEMTNAQLWTGAEGKSTKGKGSSEEKIRRCFNAIATYNDTIATGDGDRLAITNQAIRALSGVNGLIVGEWIKNHTDEIINHHSKFDMLNPRNPNTVETYYNKRLGEGKINAILGLINTELLDGVALKKK